MANGIYAFTGHINQAAPARWRQTKPMVSDRKFINLLQLLYEAEVDARLSEAEWLESSRKLIAYIKIQKLELPEIVWHYLSDYDIRLKNANIEYRSKQMTDIYNFLIDQA